MPNVHLILTVDYELFGDGSGCVDACVLLPAERMMQIVERVGARLTFFAEALEFIALANQLSERRPQEQLRQALVRGHDVQLHLHPQWMGARVNAERGLQPDMTRWRIGDLQAEEAAHLIDQGKRWLEEEVARNVRGYRCLAFRAGGWCIQPSHHIVHALLESGFVVDSTVAPGQWRPGRGEWSDFRVTPAQPFWKTQGDVCKVAQKGLWEVPITGGTISPLRHLRSLLTARSQVGAGMAANCIGSYRGPENGILGRLFGKSARLARLGRVMLDICSLPAADLIEVTQQWLKRYGEHNGMPIPVVVIAHTKNFAPSSEQAMADYLSWARDAGFTFSTYGKWLSALEEEKAA